jgi:hypothetical protein
MADDDATTVLIDLAEVGFLRPFGHQRPFTPRSAQHIVVHAGGGTVPWPILEKLVHVLDASGDLIEDQLARSPRRPHFP